MTRACEQCGQSFDGKTSRARYCSSKCRRRANYTGAAARRRVLEHAPATADPSAATVADAVLAVFRAHRLEGSPRCMAALVLARRLDDPTTESGAGLAAVSKQLDALIDAALAAVPTDQAADPLDVLRARRRVRRLAEEVAS